MLNKFQWYLNMRPAQIVRGGNEFALSGKTVSILFIILLASFLDNLLRSYVTSSW